MPRPEKYDRVKKLVAFETGHIPLRVSQRKEKMHLTFGTDVSREDIPLITDKLKRCIPFEVVISIEEEE